MQEINFIREEFIEKNQLFNYQYYPVFFIIFISLMLFFSFEIYVKKLQSDEDLSIKEKELVILVNKAERSSKYKNSENENYFDDQISLINKSSSVDYLIEKTDGRQYYLFFKLVKNLEELGFSLMSVNIDGVDSTFNAYLISKNIVELKSINVGLSYDGKSSFKIDAVNVVEKNDVFEYYLSGKVGFYKWFLIF